MAVFWMVFLYGVLPFLVALVFGLVGALRGDTVNGPKRSAVSPLEARALKDDEIATSMTKVIRDLQQGAPARVEAKAERAGKAILALIPLVRENKLGPSAEHTVRATATSYFPEAVEAYLKLPEDYRLKTAVDGDKTPLDLLCDQMDLLNRQLEKILAAASTETAEDLIVHGRFLEDKFRGSELDVVPTSAPRIGPEKSWGGLLDAAVDSVRDAGPGDRHYDYEMVPRAGQLTAGPVDEGADPVELEYANVPYSCACRDCVAQLGPGVHRHRKSGIELWEFGSDVAFDICKDCGERFDIRMSSW